MTPDAQPTAMKVTQLLISILLFAPLLHAAPARAAQVEEPAPEAPKEDLKPRVTHSSTLWIEAKYEVQGQWSIVHTPAKDKAPAKTELVLAADFETKKGPDLKLVLSPQKASDVKSKNALNKGLVLGILKRYSGESRFVIPPGTDLSKYRSLAIHCEEYTKLWATTPLTAGQVVAKGSSWVKKDRKIRGHWEIVKLDKKHVLRLGEDFDTKKGPDLKVVLSPQSIQATTGDNALKGAKIVAPLTDDEGAQSYDLGASFKLAEYRSLLIHCEQYSKLWGGVALR